MALFACVLLLGLRLVQGEECNAPKERSSESQLRHDLFMCNYFKYEPPKLSNFQLTTVDIKFSLRYFYIDADKNTVLMQTSMFLMWEDERLKWDPEKYNGITETGATSRYIWMPRFKLNNSIELFDFDYLMYHSRCKLKNNGHVVCVTSVPFEAPCSMKLANFPYDIQNCDLSFGSENRFYVNTNSSRVMRMFAAGYGSQWTITDYKQKWGQEAGKQLNITITFDREATGFAAVVIYPSLILSCLTIASIFLNVRSNVRLLFVCFSIASHYFWLTELAEILPKDSLDPPKILLYYRGSLILTLFVFFITFVISIMCRKRTTPRSIIVFINKLVYESFAQYLVFPRWNVIDGDKCNEDWMKFANSVNSLCAIIVIISYVGLYFGFMPQPPPITY